MEKFGDKVATNKLQTAQHGELPLRVQHLRNWPDEMTHVPAAVASTMNPAQLYKASADAAARLHENEQNDQRVKIAVLEDQTALFTLLTEPMVTTAPLLRLAQPMPPLLALERRRKGGGKAAERRRKGA